VFCGLEAISLPEVENNWQGEPHLAAIGTPPTAKAFVTLASADADAIFMWLS
jgi:hypothetical protein